MTPRKLAATLLMVIMGVLTGLSTTARATSYYYDSQNHLVEINYDDKTWMEYTYDENGNLIAKTYHNNNSYTITASTATTGAGTGGSVSPPSASVPSGGSQTFNISSNPGYTLVEVDVDGLALPGPVSSYTFTNVVHEHWIEARFSGCTCTITASVSGQGTVSPASANVNCGGSQTVTITPGSGQSILDVQVDGISQGRLPSYTFADVTSNHNLVAYFGQVPAASAPVMNAQTGGLYQHLRDAYNAASNGDTIWAQNTQFSENFDANQDISVTIVGGFSSDFSAVVGKSTVVGRPTISNGVVTMGNFIISN
jgi:YD repeat-containing protein